MLMVTSKPGQLGNMLFVYSNVVACAVENRLTVANSALDDYADLFPATSNDLLSRFPWQSSRLRPTRRRRALTYKFFNLLASLLEKTRLRLPWVRQITLADWNISFDLGDAGFLGSLKPRQLVLLRGWLFRDVQAMSRHADRVREFFRLHEQNQRNIDELIARARQDADILTGVHIRHGIIHFANTRKYFYTARRYAEMMAEMAAMFPDKRVAFLICSDWPQDAAVYSGLKTTFGTGDLIEDMYAFARCDYLIGAPSTFTMWSSFYGRVPLNVIRRADQRLRLEDFQVEQ